MAGGAPPVRAPPRPTVAGLYTVPMESDGDDHSDPVPVASFATMGEAEVVQAKLRAYGIEAAFDDVIEGGAVSGRGRGWCDRCRARRRRGPTPGRILAEDDAGPGESPGE